MEHDVVLSDEMNKFCILALPPCLPTLRQKFLSVGNISDRSIKPHIEHLALRTLYRYRHSPVKVTAHRTRLKPAVNPTLALAIHIASPLLVTIQNPLGKPFFILVERKVPMLGLLLHKLTAAESRLRIDEFIGTESRSTFLALVAVSSICATTRACSGDISVCKESLGLLVVILFAHLLDELAFVIKFLEEARRVLVMYG